MTSGIDALFPGAADQIVIINTSDDTIQAALDCPAGCHGINWGAKQGGGYIDLQRRRQPAGAVWRWAHPVLRHKIGQDPVGRDGLAEERTQHASGGAHCRQNNRAGAERVYLRRRSWFGPYRSAEPRRYCFGTISGHRRQWE